MNWSEGTIRDLVALQRGHDLTESDRGRGDVPVVGAAGPNGWHNVPKAPGPGVVVGRSGGSIGEVTFVPSAFWPHNTCLYVTDFKGNDPRFVAYLLSTLDLSQLNSGAAQPSLNRNFVYPVRIRFPSPAEQQRIASILSAYDDLIENNRRRIQLLEQAARLLYKEWFVRLRFPGHEHVKIKDGVPDGWERKQLGTFAPLRYGKALRQEERVPGPYPVFGSSGVVGTHAEPLIQGPTIIVGRKGNVGSVYWSADDCYPIDTVYFIESEKCSLRLYYALSNMAFVNTDVAVPGLNRDYAHSRTILTPKDNLHLLFEDTVAPIHQQIHALHRLSAKLSEARDLLLPRLMSGALDV